MWRWNTQKRGLVRVNNAGRCRHHSEITFAHMFRGFSDGCSATTGGKRVQLIL